MAFEARNIGAILLDLAEADPGAIAVEYEGRRHSRADILASSGELAAFFREEGVTQGASVAILAADQLRGIEAMIALWSLGAAVLFLDPRQPIADIASASERAGIDLVFSDSRSFARRGQFGYIPPRGDSGRSGPQLAFPDRSEDSDALILSSSGTTDVPRFRRRSHRAFIEGVDASSRLLNIPSPKSAVILGSLAFGAVLGHWIKLMVHGQFILGLPLFFRPGDLHHALSRAEIETCGLPPVLIRDLLEFHATTFPDANGPAYPHIVRLTSVGGPIAPHDLVRAYKLLTPGVHNLYSMSGVGTVSSLAGEDVLRKPGSVGKPFDELIVRIVDEEDHELPAGHTGRVIVTPTWKADGGPVDSGDLGRLDEEGYLFLTGRAQQMACRNSINVNLGDLEADVKRLSGVRDCIAFAVQATDTFEDRIYLAVETNFQRDEISARIRSSIASYRRPDKILVSPALPRNASNKIALGKLRSEANDEEYGIVDF